MSTDLAAIAARLKMWMSWIPQISQIIFSNFYNPSFQFSQKVKYKNLDHKKSEIFNPSF